MIVSGGSINEKELQHEGHVAALQPSIARACVASFGQVQRAAERIVSQVSLGAFPHLARKLSHCGWLMVLILHMLHAGSRLTRDFWSPPEALRLVQGAGVQDYLVSFCYVTPTCQAVEIIVELVMACTVCLRCRSKHSLQPSLPSVPGVVSTSYRCIRNWLKAGHQTLDT